MPIGSPQWMYASGEDAFTIDQSLRFDDGSSTYLNRTPSSAGNRRTWTFSTWMKMGTLVGSGSTSMFTAYWGNNDNGYLQFGFDSSDRLGVWGYDTTWRVSTQVFRDTSAWYHIVLAVDTTNGTAQNRIRVYINGSEITVWTTNNTVTEDLDTAVNYNGAHYLGSLSTTQAFHDGYLSEVHLIDGTQLTPSSFGETGDYGEWKPKKVSGLTYGTNGFYLSFAGGGIIAATGGTITTDGDYKVHSFTADGTFTTTSVPATDNYVEYLVIAGGGGGGGGHGGGGGAGGYRTGVLTVTAQAYSITVGDGGTAGDNSAGSGGGGGDGDDSVFSTITSTGGGGAGGRGNQNGRDGGSGGGSNEANTIGSGTAGQGNDGGTGANAASYYGGGGGGGASAVGADGTGSGGGDGGAGLASSITGSAVTRGGGGGGGQAYGGAQSSGGAGGGGDGANTNVAGDNGSANTGGGGGGGYYSNSAGGAGGSGIVIIRYKFQ